MMVFPDGMSIGLKDESMAWSSRVCPPGIPQHIIQSGNNRHVCLVVVTADTKLVLGPEVVGAACTTIVENPAMATEMATDFISSTLVPGTPEVTAAGWLGGAIGSNYSPPEWLR